MVPWIQSPVYEIPRKTVNKTYTNIIDSLQRRYYNKGPKLQLNLWLVNRTITYILTQQLFLEDKPWPSRKISFKITELEMYTLLALDPLLLPSRSSQLSGEILNNLHCFDKRDELVTKADLTKHLCIPESF